MLNSTRLLLRGLTQGLGMAADDGEASSSSDGPEDEAADAGFQPSVLDVLVVKVMLQRGLRLPPELVDAVVDAAEYWPHTTAEVDYRQNGQQALPVTGGGGHGPDYRESRFLLRTPPLGSLRTPLSSDDNADYYTTPLREPLPLQAACSSDEVRSWLHAAQTPSLEHPCRKIVFTLSSRDQGSGLRTLDDDGDYRESWTWFDVGLERYEGEEEKKDDKKEEKKGKEPSLATLRSVIPPVAPPAGHPPDIASYNAMASGFYQPLLPDARRLQSNSRRQPPTPAGGRHGLGLARGYMTHRIEWRWTDRIGTVAGVPDEPHGPGSEYKPDPPEGPSEVGPSEADRAAMEALERAGRGGRTADGSFVRGLRLGDVVTVWAKARFPGWTNWIQHVRVDVYWAV